MTRVTVQIGDIRRIYQLWTTTSPKAYDGCGTLEVYDPGEVDGRQETRYVLIEEGHVAWQTARYASGLGTPAANDEISEAEIANRLWDRIHGQKEQ